MMKSENGNTCYRLFIIPALLFFISCGPDTLSEKRAQKAAVAKGDILIGVVKTSIFSEFLLEGVILAVDEINHRGGLSGRKIKTIIYDDHGDPRQGAKIAAKLAGNEDVIAVVGHGESDTAIAASIIYEKAGIVFISDGAMDPDLTLYGGKFTFRNIPTGKAFGTQIARFLHSSKLKKAVVIHERRSVNKSTADIVKKEATALGIEIMATRSYFNWQNDFKDTVAQLKKECEFDSVVISGNIPAAANLVKQLREMEISVPIIGDAGLDSPDLFAIAGRAADGIIVPTVFNPDYPDKLTRDFVRKFESQYELPPDTWAAQGYDAVSLLAHAIEKSGSTVPAGISSHLRFLEKWNGVTGSYAFVPEGDITGKEIYFKKMQKGDFVFVGEKQDYDSDLFNYIDDFTLRLPLQNPVLTLDPGLIKNESDIEVCEQLFLGLTGLEPLTYRPVPELAKDWKRILDLVYIFNMREDAVWTNGQPVTAHDVLWTIRHHLHPDTQAPNAHDLFILKNAKAIYNGEIKDISKLGVFVVDNFSVGFKLEHPVSYFPALVSLPLYRPLPGTFIEKHKDKWTEVDNIQTNGPYKPVIWQKGKGMFLKKNPGYFDAENVSIPEVRYYIIPQNSVGLAMYENNELDIMGSGYLRLPSAAIPRIRKGPLKNQYHEDPHFCTYSYAFNTKLPPVDNPLVRKALSAAIDRQLLIDAVNQGNGEPAGTLTRPPLFGSVPVEAEAGIDFDPFQARKWLAEAGYPDGRNFPEITILHRKSNFHEKIARGVQSLLQHHLNIFVKLRQENRSDYTATVTRGKPSHIFRTKVCNVYPDADSSLKIFDPSDPFYRTGWENQEFVKLIRDAKRISDPKKREALYKRAEEILCKEEAVAIPLYFEIYYSLVKPKVKGWSHMAMGGQLLHNWYFDDK